ncbi:hypothetical protein [Clostridium sp. Marseille-P2415]|uniref:hypothetical protein n=1 Tax=Clostridium sp. Marseille-P2415 TaxID=1805471 RepID=UPI0009888C60|nr:hypothetical protein [Clostridium sp. Marseille-P2415]
MEFQLNQYGYITNYLVSGKKETGFFSDAVGKDQLACEKIMREQVADHNEKMPEGIIRAGEISSLGMPWEYDYNFGSWFVDRSAFYPLLKKIELHAASALIAPENMEAEVWLWSYASVDLWVNGEYAGGIKTPVYKPINRQVLHLKLKKGENLIFVRLQNLGVRDTRTLFGIQIPGEEKKVLKVALPDDKAVKKLTDAGEWLSSITMEEGKLLFSSAAPGGSTLIYDSKPVDFLHQNNRYTRHDISGHKNVPLQPGCPYFKVEVAVGSQRLTRSFERQEILGPVWSGVSDREENRERIYERIASVGQIPRGEKESFSMYPILARCYTNAMTSEDRKEILKSLDQIESRRDCSDFLTCALVRFIKLYSMDEELAVRCREVMLNYRYWMDEKGSDGMCFWSENHSLMFFVSAYLAGSVYSNDLFIRSGRTGKEMEEAARIRIYDWMEETLKEGFDEFHSGGYTPITFAAILNVVDFGDEELSGLAVKVADRLLHDLSLQTFKGVCIAPMGRVYREVLYPYAQDIQCLVNLLDPKAPDKFSEWIIFLATSKYKLPSRLDKIMKQQISMVYGESNARICVEKNEAYMLTSVQSPRDGEPRVWENIYGREDACQGSFAYVKSLNECFHGTTQFEPGVFGYQQHMWYAALDPAAVVFVNHPGGSCETSSTRPGYWFGNGIMPALKQVKNVLFGIYRIPESHPIPFTHVYWPKSRFKEQIMEDGWTTGKAGTGYVALWCSEPLKAYEDQLFDCEYRAESRNTAYVCVCGSQEEFGSLREFLDDCKKKEPVYDKENSRLQAGNDGVIYEKHENLTQYI